ncbi:MULTISPECIES: hypothetical protein [unclassified Microbacterium]|uniref:hypothetical protein n=1 Tax=unclassified Microbacterium TaxID=2609290 RepID=UPI00301AD521
MTLTTTTPTRVYRTERAARRDRGGVPALVPGTYTALEQRGRTVRIPAGWINTKGIT